MTISSELLREIMRGVPAPVGIVVAPGLSSGWRGMTASSMTSVCLAPPLISINVTRGSQMHMALASDPDFTFNMLSAGQRHLAERFARSRMTGAQQFTGVGYEIDECGAVILDGAVSWMHCATHSRFDAGDHAIVIGRVEHAALLEASEPLVVHGGTFHTLGPETEVDPHERGPAGEGS